MQNTPEKKQLSKLIRQAARGNYEAIQALLLPLLSEDENLIAFGLGAKMGFLPTYDFYFLTNFRVGDLQVTPWIGALHIESAYLDRIDSFAINQPPISIVLRLAIAILYLLTVSYVIQFSIVLGSTPLGIWWTIAIMAPILAALLLLIYKAITPFIKRVYLRICKSGITIRIYANPQGVLIFSDRTKVQELIQMTKLMMAAKSAHDAKS